MNVTVGYISETDYESELEIPGIRTAVIESYEIPKLFYATGYGVSKGKGGIQNIAAARVLANFGALIRYAEYCKRTCHPRKVKRIMDLDALLLKWREVIVGLAIAHDKDEADRYEAAINECLTPILTAPIAQVREFARRFLELLKADKRVPFLVWRSYEVWVQTVIANAGDEEIKQLKTALASEIVAMVEEDAKAQLPEAMVRALQWRDPEKLEKVKKVVQSEKEKGNPIRLRGRESCLFLEAGGTEENPEVCVQV